MDAKGPTPEKKTRRNKSTYTEKDPVPVFLCMGKCSEGNDPGKKDRNHAHTK